MFFCSVYQLRTRARSDTGLNEFDTLPKVTLQFVDQTKDDTFLKKKDLYDKYATIS
jgi:hypothetical protein